MEEPIFQYWNNSNSINKIFCKTPTVEKKPHDGPSYMKRKRVITDIFRCEHIKKGIISEETSLYQSFKSTEGV